MSVPWVDKTDGHDVEKATNDQKLELTDCS